MNPELTAIVVAYNSGPELARCLDSVRREAAREGLSAELLVVDNASVDGCTDGLPDDVTLLRNADNRGFGAAVNQGFRASRGERVLLLNPDARLTSGALRPLLDAVARPDVALAAPTLRLPDGTNQESPRRFYSLPAVLAQRTPWGRSARGAEVWREHHMEGYDRAAPADVDWVTGAAMVLDRGAVSPEGPFDERYFLYFEDVDLCRRLRAGGRAVRFVPEAVVEHDFRRGSRRQVPWNPLLWQHLLSGLLYAGRWSAGWWSGRRWRAVVGRGVRAGSRAGLLAAVGLALGLPPLTLALAVLVTLLVLPSRRAPVVGREAAPPVVRTAAAVLAGGLAVGVTGWEPVAGWFLGGTAALILGHGLATLGLGWLRRRGFFHRAALVAGTPAEADALRAALRENPEEGLSVLGFVPLDPLAAGGPTPRLPDWSRVEQVAADHRADVVLVTGRAEGLARMAGGVVALREAGVPSAFVLSGATELLQEEASATLAGLPVLPLGAGPEARVSRVIRGWVDRSVAAVALLALAPALLVLGLLSRVAFGQALVRAERVGLGGRSFGMLRLRTGREVADAGGGWLGGLLRRLHLDELPQLWNVLRGEMSLVGPRPVTRDVWESLEEWERARCLVRPGITGMWQLDRMRRWRLEQMIVSDLLYLLRWSPRLDLRILARTLLGR